MENTNNNEQVRLSTEEQFLQMRGMNEMRHKALSRLIEAQLLNYGATLITTNGVSYQTKLQTLREMISAVLFSLDVGLDITKPELKQKGQAAKNQASLAGLLAQALDNRFLLIADNMRKADLEQNNSVESSTGETQGEENNVQQ